jgi:hypothetical protein
MDAAQGASGAHSHTTLVAVVGTLLQFWVNNACGDCSPPQPLIPDVFTFGNNVLVGGALLGLILFLVFFALAIVTFVRTRRRPADVPPR